MTWTFTHIEGIRYNGLWGYLRSWIPEVPKAILPLIIVIEVLLAVHAPDQPLGQALRQHARRATS